MYVTRTKVQNRTRFAVFVPRGLERHRTDTAAAKPSLPVICPTVHGVQSPVWDSSPTHAKVFFFRSKLYLPQAIRLVDVADRKFGSRMDALILIFG